MWEVVENAYSICRQVIKILNKKLYTTLKENTNVQ